MLKRSKHHLIVKITMDWISHRQWENFQSARRGQLCIWSNDPSD